MFLADERVAKPNDEFDIEFSDFDAVVSKYRSKLRIDNPRNSAILNLSMVDVNKGKIVDYLNETYNLKIEEDEAYETLGGFIVYHNENIPKQDEVIEINN